ncbi:MAG TPA: sarcosine oxidase subunit gamma family protein [Pseudonocardiaceae bacterium]|jgi:sarcosine oxidase subunit gamma|nr:sarcosine oxidase subunit gamma family protein [Pseudonocardiaceae bacterium]
MADPVALLRRSPLADRAETLAAASSDAVTLTEVPFLTAVNLRVDPDSDAARRVGERLGTPLPDAPNTVADAGSRCVLWLGPDEWLVVGPDGDAPALLALLGDEPDSVVDVSANRTTVQVSGPSARDLLEKGCTLDLHPRAFGVGRCAQSTVAKAQVVLWQTADTPVYRLLVRGSFSGYLADWLIDAAGEYAISL